MAFLKNDDNFIKTDIVRQAIVYVSKEMNIDEKLVEQVVLSFFKTLKMLFINATHKRVSIYNFGKFILKLNNVEKALRQLENEENKRLNEMNNE